MKKIFLLTLLVTLAVSSCKPAGPKIMVDTAWGRQSPKTATAGAFYMFIRNAGLEEDKLIGAKSAACKTVELHESYQTPEGAMGMRRVTGDVIAIPPGATVELKVGGLHLMCIDKLQDFNSGAQIELTLRFEKSGDVPLTADIRE
ncbi:MAG: copper chaperone PCu(A)C [Chloroflexi bacterium]|nr:copper chaperone PCu(A)C [Chloroflexota bacterium]MBI5081731.1 copper chaperone PCu(A)C [Chloroflexota bacterium]